MNSTIFSRISEADPVAAGQSSMGAMYGGAATTGVAWALSANGIIAIAGLLIAAAGFALNAYFSVKRNERERERRAEEKRLHALQIAKLTHIEKAVDDTGE